MTEKNEVFDPTDFIYQPPRATSVAIKEITRRMNVKYRLDWGIPEIDYRWIPPVPGDKISIIGRPGHTKTTTMLYLAKRWAKLVRSQKDANGRSPLIIYATWETTVEEFMAVYTAGDSGQSLESIGRGTADLMAIENAMVATLSNNVVIIGQSNDSKQNRGQLLTNRTPMPTLVDLDLCLQYLHNQGFTIAAVFIDYLQRIPGLKPLRSSEDRALVVGKHVEELKDLAVVHQVPLVVGVQAGRHVDKYAGLQLPADGDGQWSSNIEQTSDKIISITRPAKYLELNQKLDINGMNFNVLSETIVLKMLKQRFGPQDDADMWALECDFASASLKAQKSTGLTIPC